MLSKIERETVIVFNEEESTAIVGTYNEKLKHRLFEYLSKSNDCTLIKSNDDYVEYSVPKKWIKVNMSRQYTDEQRQAMAERARNNLVRK